MKVGRQLRHYRHGPVGGYPQCHSSALILPGNRQAAPIRQTLSMQSDVDAIQRCERTLRMCCIPDHL